MAPEAVRFFKRLAEKMAYKNPNTKYADNISFIRRRLRFDLLRTTLIALRGYRGKRVEKEQQKIADLDFHLERRSGEDNIWEML